MKFPSSVYNYDVISDSWFLIIKINRYQEASLTDFTCLKSKNWSQQTARPPHMGCTAPREGKVLWKTTTKIKVSIYWKESIIFQSKCFILKKVLY